MAKTQITGQQIANGASGVDLTVDVTGTLPKTNGGTGNTTGLAATATKLATARAINGVNFDGSAAITIADSTKVPTTTTVNGHALSSNVTVTASDVGLGNVDNTSDAAKNSATATVTNKTIDASNNTITNLGPSSLAASAVTPVAISSSMIISQTATIFGTVMTATSKTFVLPTDCTAMVTGYARIKAPGNGTAVVHINIDGTDVGDGVSDYGYGNLNATHTGSYFYQTTLTAGSHTIKLTQSGAVEVWGCGWWALFIGTTA